MNEILTEVAILSARDCLKVSERYKTKFDYPLHRHDECELNFVYNAAGVRRVVGDSVQTIGPLELVLVTGENLEHVWEQGECQSQMMREITIHFPQDLLPQNLLSRAQFSSISEMLVKARFGITFSPETIMKVYHLLDSFTQEKDGFMQFLGFLRLLYVLSGEDYKVLASKSFARQDMSRESSRIMKVREYVMKHLDWDITLDMVANVVGMSPSAFSRYFKASTGETFSSYLTEMRLGYAQRELVDSTKNISEICYESGFNNLSNFNRVFHAKRGMTPKEFRQLYKKNKITI